MNNRKIRSRMSIIELRMLLTDMKEANYRYTDKNAISHEELLNRLKDYL